MNELEKVGIEKYLGSKLTYQKDERMRNTIYIT
jgi:hypothetical protein